MVRNKKIKFIKYSLIFIITLLIALRLALPYYLLHYVENQINQIPEYKITINDLDISLYSGSYTLKNIQLWKINNNIPVPFYSAQRMTFSIDWHAILQRKIVAQISVEKPIINFVTASNNKNEQLTISNEWIDIVKSLYPLNINTLIAHQGEVKLISYSRHSPYKIYINNIEFNMSNMQKATDKEKLLSSSFNLIGNVIGGGTVNLNGKYAPLNKQATFKLEMTIKNLQVQKNCIIFKTL